jgi:hypothetical protein
MHSSLSIVRDLAWMVVVAATQYQERGNNGNVDLEALNLTKLVGFQSDESKRPRMMMIWSGNPM